MMKQIVQVSFLTTLLCLLSACGGRETVAPFWEQKTQPNSTNPYKFARNFDMIADPAGDLVSLGNLTVDADPSTPALDSEHVIILTKQQPEDGSLIWESILPFPNGGFSLYEVESDDEGNLYVAGEGFVLKTDSYGQLLWQQSFEPGQMTVTSITLKNDLVYVSGHSTRIYDVHGNLQLTIDNGDIYPWEVVVTDNSDIIQATWNSITRHDAAGNLLWSVPAPDNVTTRAVVELDDQDDIYVSYVGNDDPGGTSASSKLLKISGEGDVQWTALIPDNRGTGDYFKAGKVEIYLTSDNQLLNVASGKGGRQLTRLNKDTGAMIWERVYTGEGVIDDSYLTEDDVLYVAGDSNPQSFDRNGNLMDTFAMPDSTFRNSLVMDNDRFYVAGNVYENEIFKLYTAAFPRSE
ncbi:MAG: PQQ-binding-like beta-propeller repeat protein [Ketobacteraceae bacterium]|nr:PQQ-binding-like beta-propeller repeat protein [Ketobacteraceae bacterium]